jgi:hypothetical protein
MTSLNESNIPKGIGVHRTLTQSVSSEMNNQEKAVARKFFKSRILEADGQAFEDLFVRIMSLAVPGFTPIKPHGLIGDRKNDGYVEATGTYYQVFAPEDLNKISKTSRFRSFPTMRSSSLWVSHLIRQPYLTWTTALLAKLSVIL